MGVNGYNFLRLFLDAARKSLLSACAVITQQH